MSGKAGAGAGSAPEVVAATATVMAPTAAVPCVNAMIFCLNPSTNRAFTQKTREVECPSSSTVVSTLGIDYTVWNAEGRKVQVWSTSGQGRFSSSRSSYFRGVEVAIIPMNVSAVEMGKQLKGLKEMGFEKPLVFVHTNALDPLRDEALPPALSEAAVSALIASEGINTCPIKFVTLEGVNDKTALVAQIHELHAAQLALSAPSAPAGSL